MAVEGAFVPQGEYCARGRHLGHLVEDWPGVAHNSCRTGTGRSAGRRCGAGGPWAELGTDMGIGLTREAFPFAGRIVRRHVTGELADLAATGRGTSDSVEAGRWSDGHRVAFRRGIAQGSSRSRYLQNGCFQEAKRDSESEKTSKGLVADTLPTATETVYRS